MAQILIIEDEVLLAKSLSRALTMRGHDCAVATTAEEGLSLLERTPTDIVLLDLQLPGMSGLDAIERIRAFDANISVIIATAYGTMATVVQSMRAGACDFLRKPLDIEEVQLAVERAVAGARLRQTVSYYHDLEAGKTDEDQLICESPGMRRVAEVVQRLADMKLQAASDYPPVLLLGETGTGKDLVARKIHFSGALSEQPFIEVNCTTLPRGLEEAELFGYEKGAFTGAERSKRGLFEAAAGGTIFLNEIGDLATEAQVKLLQVIEQKTMRRVGGLRDMAADVRIIAATNRDLKNSRYFREDLYYRLNNVTIELPPLRRRREDIIPLATHFLARFNRKYGRKKTLDEQARRALLDYQWPGNVRELRQLMERVTFLNDRTAIGVADLGLPAAGAPTAAGNDGFWVDLSTDRLNLEEIEREIILRVLQSCAGNVSQAARKLGLGREALRYRIKKYDLPA